MMSILGVFGIIFPQLLAGEETGRAKIALFALNRLRGREILVHQNREGVAIETQALSRFCQVKTSLSRMRARATLEYNPD